MYYSYIHIYIYITSYIFRYVSILIYTYLPIYINSIFFHLFLLAILTLDFSIFTPQPDREKIVPIEFISFPAIKDERAKRNNDSLSTRRNNNIEIIGVQPADGSRIPGIRRWKKEYTPKIFQNAIVDKIIDISPYLSFKLSCKILQLYAMVIKTHFLSTEMLSISNQFGN